MGEIWLARELKLERMVALKVVRADLTQDSKRVTRFRQEARAASALNHPNVCTIYALGDTPDGRQFIAMEHIAGATLRQRLADGRLSTREALDIAVQVASALSSAHVAGIVHRDLKPENVMLRPDGFVKLVDFGLAKLAPVPVAVADATLTVVNTDVGAVVGTVTYMSPEQARGHEVDARTDVWSMGVMLYEMVAGRNPFAGQSSSDVLAAILDREPTPLSRFKPNVPNELQRIVSKALRKHREQRYQVMEDLLLDLQALRDELTAQATRNTKEHAGYVSGRLRRHPVGAALAACVIALIVAVGVWWTIRHRRTGDELTARSATIGNTVPVQRNQTRLTIAPGLQTDVAWSADGRFIAYASDQTGNFDIWVQPVGGGDAVQVTRSPAQERQPAWSPDNNSIVFRSERDGGGLYVIPAFGGSEQQVAGFGVRPQWTADGAHVVFASTDLSGLVPKLYLVGLDGRPPQQILEDFTDGLFATRGWSLHPDGRRISVLASARTDQEGLFTVPLSGGQAVLSKDSTDHQRLITGGSRGFAWSPSGAALFLERVERAKTDLWRLVLNPQTLEQLTTERMTTGGGVHKGPAVSPDGKRIAFTNETQAQRLWSFPLEPGTSRIKGAGTPITESGAQALSFDLTRDGRKLAYALAREGVDREELWAMDLVTGVKQLLGVERVRGWQQWAPDGKRVAYPVFRWTDKSQTQGEAALVVRTVEGSGEQAVTTFTPFQGGGATALSRSKYMTVWDWTPDGQGLIVGSDQFTPFQSLYQVPLESAPHAEAAKKLLASDTRYQLWQANVSPNGRWIAFMAHMEASGAATIAVMPSTGATASQWTHVTDPREWADKPRWSPDGKLLYFIGRRTSFFNVWAVRFDSETGKAIGAPFEVTHFNSPGFRFSTRLAYGDLSVSSTRLIVPIMETSGSIWMLDNVDR